MMFLRQVVLSTLLLTSALASPTPPHSESTITDWDLFHQLIENIDEDSIHAILHSLAPKFKHGVFSKDRSAIEQVHSENPPLATSLVELAKRASNATTTTVSPASSSIASVESSLSSVQASLSSAKTSLSSAASSLASAKSSVGTTQANSVSSAHSSEAASASSKQASLTSAEASLSSELAASSAYTASTKPAPTSLALAPTTPVSATPISTIPGAVIFSKSGGGLVTVASSTAFVTYSRESSEVLSTYTLPNGQLTTATSLVVVNAPITGSVEAASPSAGAAATTGSGAGLQSGAARPTQGYLVEVGVMLGAAVLAAMAL